MAGTRQSGKMQNSFYRDRFGSLMIALVSAMVILIVLVVVVLYQVFHRPRPQFFALSEAGARMQLRAFDEPNLMANVIIKWASKAAVAAYTFDFVNYNAQIETAHPYFTERGWRDYQESVAKVISGIVKNQLFVSAVVSGPPVISNQGDLPGQGYSWRVQLPFLVTYQSSETTTQKSFTVIVTIVKVPTSVNPAEIGIDQFVMTS